MGRAEKFSPSHGPVMRPGMGGGRERRRLSWKPDPLLASMGGRWSF